MFRQVGTFKLRCSENFAGLFQWEFWYEYSKISRVGAPAHGGEAAQTKILIGWCDANPALVALAAAPPPDRPRHSWCPKRRPEPICHRRPHRRLQSACRDPCYRGHPRRQASCRRCAWLLRLRPGCRLCDGNLRVSTSTCAREIREYVGQSAPAGEQHGRAHPRQGLDRPAYSGER
jgi:hypothetical protein